LNKRTKPVATKYIRLVARGQRGGKEEWFSVEGFL